VAKPYYTDEEWSIRVPSGMKGGKGFVDENGIRSYLLVRVPGVQPAVLSEPCAAYDIFPTLLDLAGVEMPQDTLPLDGVSLRPLIESGAWSHSDRYIHLHEVAKDGLFVDQVPALDENRRIVRPQPLLAYENPSKWINGSRPRLRTPGTLEVEQGNALRHAHSGGPPRNRPGRCAGNQTAAGRRIPTLVDG
jgi:hypothetical protein